MATGVVTWSQTAATNATADSAVGYSEGQAPSSLNDSARAAMASVAKWRDDFNGTITTGGTSTAYTVTSNQGFASLSALDKALIGFVPHTACGNTVTLSVDSLAAKPLRTAPGVELTTAMLIQGKPYIATYNNSDGAFYINGLEPLSGGAAGYGPAGLGIGSAVTQSGLQTNPVTINALCGAITMVNSSFSQGVLVPFKVNNSKVAATDVIVATHKDPGSGNNFLAWPSLISAGSFYITVDPIGNFFDAPVINFAVVKAVAS